MKKSFSRLFKSTLFLLGLSLFFSGCQSVFNKKETAGLQVSTEGSNATVYLNGEISSKTPYVNKELKPGTYTLRIEPDNSEFVPYETSVTLYPATLAVLNWKFAQTPETSGGVLFEMEPIKDKEKALLSIVSIPDSTIVHIDGKSEGFTPIIINNVTPGSHQYEITLPSYLPQSESVELNAGYQMNITVKLAKDPIALELKMNSDLQATDSAEASDSAKKNEDDSDQSVKPTTTPVKSTNTTDLEPPYVEILETGTGWLRVRAQASGSSEELAKVDVGEKYSYFQTEDGWFQIEYETGKKGWISGQYGKLVK